MRLQLEVTVIIEESGGGGRVVRKQGATIFPVLSNPIPHFKITCSEIGSGLAHRSKKF